MIVTNHSEALEKALNLDSGSVRHEANFRFSGTLNGHKIFIYTWPVDEDANQIKVNNITFEEDN